LGTIFKGIWPFMIAAMVAISMITIFPEIATYLPNHM
jgi:C4-dicarboxylate transporter, DctM subunit